jgi:uncharacterized membrane protein YfcA
MNFTVSDVFNFDTAKSSPVVFVASMISGASGTGGGVVYGAVFQALNGMGAHEAIPLALFMAFGTSVGSAIFLIPKRHPLVDRPLIDYRLALILEAPTLFGALGGVLLNVMSPEFLVFTFVVVFLALSGWRALASFRIQWKKGFCCSLFSLRILTRLTNQSSLNDVS